MKPTPNHPFTAKQSQDLSEAKRPAVLSAKSALVEKAVASTTTEIRIVVEGGVVHEVLDVPPDVQVTILDYDTEGVEEQCLEISPVDGKLCAVSRFFGEATPGRGAMMPKSPASRTLRQGRKRKHGKAK